MDKKLTITERRNFMLKEAPLAIPSPVVAAGKKFKDIANTPERTSLSMANSIRGAAKRIPGSTATEKAQGYTNAASAGKDMISLGSRNLKQTPGVQAFRTALSTKVTPGLAMIGGELDARRRLQNISTSTPTLDKTQAIISRVSGLAPTVGAVVGGPAGAAVGSTIGLAGTGVNMAIDKYKDDKQKERDVGTHSHLGSGYNAYKPIQQANQPQAPKTYTISPEHQKAQLKSSNPNPMSAKSSLKEENNIKALKYAIRLLKKEKHHKLYGAYPHVVAGGVVGDMMAQGSPGLGTAITTLSPIAGSLINLAHKQRGFKKILNRNKKKKLKEETLSEARIKLIKARIRGGKIQRRKKVSNVPGMTLRDGKLKRMSATERRNRRMGQRKGKIKRRAKLTRTLQKRRRSLQKRKMLGLG